MLKRNFELKWEDFHTLIFDFDGVFTNNKVYIDETGKEIVRCDRSDGLAFDILRKFQEKKKWNIQYFILSKEKNQVVQKRAEKLKIKCFQDVSNKKLFIEEYLKKRFGFIEDAKKGVLYAGNDLNDLSAMRYCGYSIAPSDAHKLIKEKATLVLDKKGGEGFVRKIIEIIINFDAIALDDLPELI